MRTLIAAAVPTGAVVRVGDIPFTVDRRESSTPMVGMLTWHDNKLGQDYRVSAILEVEIISLPPVKETSTK